MFYDKTATVFFRVRGFRGGVFADGEGTKGPAQDEHEVGTHVGGGVGREGEEKPADYGVGFEGTEGEEVREGVES